MEEEILEKNRWRRRSTFALIVRGYPEDFAELVELAKVYGCYVVYSKTSFQKLIVEEVPF